MKKTLYSLCLLSLLFSCKKNSHADIPQIQEETFPQDWLLIADVSVDKYTYLELAGNSMKRSEIEKSYSLAKLAEESYCKFHIAQSTTEFTHQKCITIQFDRQRKRWLFAGKSSNGQEIHLSTTAGSEIEDPGGDGYKFFMHLRARVNGVKTVALESVDQPGYYISTASPGFNYSPTQVVLTKESSPEKATAWQCR